MNTPTLLLVTGCLFLIAESKDEIDSARAANQHADILTVQYEQDQMDGLIPVQKANP